MEQNLNRVQTLLLSNKLIYREKETSSIITTKHIEHVSQSVSDLLKKA
jgi:hypothetical protein